MKTSKQLRDERAVIQENMRDLINRAKSESRDMSAEETTQFDNWDSELNNLSSQLERAAKIEAMEAERAKKVPEVKPEPKDPVKEYENTFWKYARTGFPGLDNDEKNVMYQFRGTSPQTTSATAGGYTIPQGFSYELYQTMEKWGGMLENCRIFNTTGGETIKWPTVDDTGVTGGIMTEGSAVAVSDMTFSSKDLDAYTYTSYVVKVSRQLLQDTAFNLEEFLRDAFARRLGTGMNAHFTTGTGSSQPNGVITAASVGKTTASNSAVTRSELVDLVHSVNPAYRANAKFMFNDTTLSLIKKLAFGSADARPLWQLSMRDGEPDRIEGYEYFINQNTASFGSGNKPAAFGDFDQYVIRMAGDPVFLRLDERYADEFNVGFIAFQRADGELIGTDGIKVLRNPTT